MLFFTEIFRVSKNQIIWGGNYFIPFLPATRCFLVWDKGEGFYNRTYAECELAWTSLDKNTNKIKFDPLAKGSYKGKIHPTQKPLGLVEMLIKTYTDAGDLVLDSCMGSGTAGEACKNLGRRFIGIEIEEKYFNAAKLRLAV